MKPRRLPDLRPGTEIEGMVVQSFLGAGGYGTVYLARQMNSGRLCAVKFIPMGSAEAWGQREFAILLRLQHLNLVSLGGWGYWPEERHEYLWLRLAYIPGKTLDEWAWEHHPDAWTAAGKILGVGRGLAVAHHAQVVHRDVKEANILVREGDGEAVLVDFGAGHYARAPTITHGMFPPGTLEYRSPEAWRFRLEHAHDKGARYRAGPADDLYALGVVLYWLLTWRHPFGVTEDEDSIRAIIETPPLPPHIVNPRVPKALSAVCLKLLEKSPENRYPSAVALCEALETLRAQADDTWRVPLQDRPRPQQRREGLPRWPSGKALRRSVLWGGLVLGSVVVGWAALRSTSSGLLPTQGIASGREVASSGPLPEADGTAATPPAAAAPSAASTQDDAPVNKQKTDRISDDRKQKAKVATRGACAGLVGVALQACVGAQQQVAPKRPPPPEECPPGAVEAMTGRLGLYIGDDYGTIVNREYGGPLTVREGEVTFSVWGDHEGLVDKTLVLGRLYLVPGRVYGRFTRVILPTGESYPVCMELWEGSDRLLGSRLEKGSTPDNVLIHSLERLMAVKRFK
ncbi:serine/threonine protein kinase [Cystobacter fuscus]|uniref:non-specific serine/threonine protein kinase n=1 Tax=Cystobacter fuscus TaxID=43 RepID=A0A250JH96_9BACT|nr:serine/threonine-protein kinase [Cystobacter fuscus]ATB42781.1 serine/threonine protein kinase [Cystobacter fuscus]